MNTITIPRALLEQALEALENCTSEHGHRCNRCDSEVDEGGRVVTALRTALAQQEQEPVAWMLPRTDSIITAATKVYRGVLAENYTQPLYAHPPRREWVSLTEEEVWSQYQTLWPLHPAEEPRLAADISKFARAIEQALRSRNEQA